jgi:hypothetical protein
MCVVENVFIQKQVTRYREVAENYTQPEITQVSLP